MLIIPELKKVVITPPRSGSTALRAAVKQKYEHASSPFRHGEVAMMQHVPGLVSRFLREEWSIIYMLRHPTQRLISLWRYMHDVSYTRNARAPKEWVDRVRNDANRPFNDWVQNSTELFNESSALPNDGSPESNYCTHFQVPAARKSAKEFLATAPMRSVQLLRFADHAEYMAVLGVDIRHVTEARNESTKRHADVGNSGPLIEKWHQTDLALMRIE